MAAHGSVIICPFITLLLTTNIAHNELADFEICTQKPSVKNKKVNLKYTAGSVMADECQGNPDCKNPRRVLLVTEAKIVSNKAGVKAIKP